MRTPVRASIPLFLLLAASTSASAPVWPQTVELPRAALDAIRRSELMGHVELLAADELQGRAAGTWGGMVAARYVASRFLRAGLAFPPGLASFDQRLDGKLGYLVEGSELEVTRNGTVTPLRFRADFAAVPATTATAASGAGEAVFCGFGIHAPELGHDDFAGIAADGLAGKVAVVCAGRPPPGRDGDPFAALLPPLFPGIEPRLDPADKVREAARRGAIAVLVLPDPFTREDPIGASRNRIRWMPFSAETFTTKELAGPPGLEVGRRGVDALFGSAAELAGSLRGAAPQALAGTRVRFVVAVHAGAAPAAHVAGWIRGRDETLAREIVLVTAHLDGTGVSFDPTKVNPGADSDAAGTAALVEIAAALAASGVRPRRSVAFVAFTAEERALAGPRQYVASPVFPLEHTVAVVHLDAVARGQPGLVAIAGAAPASRLASALTSALGTEGLTVRKDLEGLARGAGQWPFLERGMQAVLVTSGPHQDLHTPADTAERLDREKLERVARGVLRAVWDLAEGGAR